MVNWQERADQERRLAAQRAAAEPVALIKPKEVDRESKEYIASMLSKFDQFNIKGMLEDINRTTPDGWGGLGKVIETEPHSWRVAKRKFIYFSEEVPSDLCTSYTIKLSGDYTHYDKDIERTYRNARGWHCVNDGGGGMSSMGEPLSVRTKRVYGDYAESSGFKDVLRAQEGSTSLFVAIGYFPRRDSYGISIEDNEIKISTEMMIHPINSDLSEKYQITPNSKLHINPKIELPFRLLLGNEYEERSPWNASAVSLSFYARDFDERIIRRFLETSFAVDTYLRRGDSKSLVAIKQKESENKIEIERGLKLHS